MSKNPMARIVSGGVYTVFAISCALAIHGTPTVSAENNITNEQVCSQPDVTNLSAGATTVSIVETINTNELVEDTEGDNISSSIGYTTTAVNIRSTPSTESDIITKYDFNDQIEYYTNGEDASWGLILNPTEEEECGYICLDYVSDEEQYEWNGPVLNSYDGTVIGPHGKETYYNLNMSKVVSYMADLGYNDNYWVRSDGAKMLGDYVMIAANLNVYPKGTIIETSLGKGIVCDTGDFTTMNNGVVFDIAVDWR